MSGTQSGLVSQLRHRAHALGFETCRVTQARLPDEIGQGLQQFLDKDYHGTMHWMAETASRRKSPQAMWDKARSAVVLGMNYGPHDNPLEGLTKRDRATISVYARNRDYHDVIKGRLKTLAGWIASKSACDVKVFVDTAPLMEKPLAAQAGMGWQGKHTNLVSRKSGSWLFLGVILTTANLETDLPESDHCGSCCACLDICPTKAFPRPYQLDARKCISYLTIEHQGPIPVEYREAMGNRIYGCDDCLAVCPWNKFARAGQEAKLVAREDLRAPSLTDLANLDDQQFRGLFSRSPIKRIGWARFLRNVLIAIGNSNDSTLLPSVYTRLTDSNPLVRGASVWALTRLEKPAILADMRQRARVSEPDPDVLREWERHE